MHDAPKTRYGFPDLLPPFAPFPETIPWDAPISSLSSWWLEVECATHGISGHPLRLMAANHGWNRTLRQVAPRLRCRLCGAAPIRVDLVNEFGGDRGRIGAKSQRHRLAP